ncbi:MAG: ATP synthase F1 subunit epsilon [Hyphomicrobiales bacterium]
MKLEIITPDKNLYNGEVSLIQLPGIDGSFEILEHHAPMISALSKGKIRVVDMERETHYFEIEGGVVEVQLREVLILLD